MASVEGSQRFVLPRPKRAVWVAVALVGAGTALFGATMLVEAPFDGLPIAYVGLGAGMFLAFFALAMLTVRERASVVEIGPAGLGVETLGGESVVLPWATLRQAVAMPRGEGQSCVVALRKADGGWVELGTFGDEDAAADMVKRLQGPIASPPEGPAGGPQLERLEGITVVRDGERTVVAWSATSFGALMALGPLVGLLVAVYGFHRNQPSTGTLVAMGFVAALGMIAVVFTLVNVGAEQCLVLSADELVVRRRRLGKVIDDQTLALRDIAAIDYTHRLNVLGASSLTIRTDRARLASEGAERRAAEAVADPDALDTLALGTALVRAIAGGVQVPLGRLPLSTRIGLDLALSEEVARRSGRAEGTV